MTPSQLERLGELINAKWPQAWVASVIDGQLHIHAYLCGVSCSIDGRWFVDWALDRLEELYKCEHIQASISLSTSKEDGSHGYQISAVVNPLHPYHTKLADADTRAECCALALLAALESEHG